MHSVVFSGVQMFRIWRFVMPLIQLEEGKLYTQKMLAYPKKILGGGSVSSLQTSSNVVLCCLSTE